MLIEYFLICPHRVLYAVCLGTAESEELVLMQSDIKFRLFSILQRQVEAELLEYRLFADSQCR